MRQASGAQGSLPSVGFAGSVKTGAERSVELLTALSLEFPQRAGIAAPWEPGCVRREAGSCAFSLQDSDLPGRLQHAALSLVSGAFALAAHSSSKCASQIPGLQPFQPRRVDPAEIALPPGSGP